MKTDLILDRLISSCERLHNNNDSGFDDEDLKKCKLLAEQNIKVDNEDVKQMNKNISSEGDTNVKNYINKNKELMKQTKDIIKELYLDTYSLLFDKNFNINSKLYKKITLDMEKLENKKIEINNFKDKIEGKLNVDKDDKDLVIQYTLIDSNQKKISKQENNIISHNQKIKNLDKRLDDTKNKNNNYFFIFITLLIINCIISVIIYLNFTKNSQ